MAGIFDTQPVGGGFPGPQSGPVTPAPVQSSTPQPTPAGPCIHGSHQGPNGNIVCNPDPAQGGGGSGTFGVDFKPWETIDTTVSQAQWKAWEGFRDPGCPANKPYKSERGAAGCFEKPVDCPDGQMPGGPGNSPCVPNPGGGGGGAGAAGGGNGPLSPSRAARDRIMRGTATAADWQIFLHDNPGYTGGSGNTGAAQAYIQGGAPGAGGLQDFGVNGTMADSIKALLEGGSRFTPGVLADITGKNKLTEQAQIAGQTDALRQSQAARGVISSPFAAAQEARVVQGAGAEFGAGQRDLRLQKAATDFSDKLQALGTAQQWLNGLRQYALGMDSNNVQREGILANLTLGRERIQAEMQQLLATIAANKDLAGMQIDSNETMNLQRQIICIQTGQC